MRNPWVAGALNLVTLVGGHFYNRRPYQGLLFLLLYLVLPLGGLLLLNAAGPFQSSTVSSLFVLVLLCMAAVFVGSAVKACLDARGGDEPETAGMRAAGTVAASLLGALLLVSTWAPLQVFMLVADDAVTANDSADPGHKFCFAQGCHSRKEPVALARGDAALRGTVRLDGEPLREGRISVVTADNRRSATAEVRDGRYEIGLPAGSYDIVAAEVDSTLVDDLWRYTATTGREDRLSEEPAIALVHGAERPLRVDLDHAGDVEDLDLALHRQPDLREPRFARDDHATAESMILDWQPTPKAAHYAVHIARVTRAGNRSTHSFIAQLTSDKAEVPLESLLVPGERSAPAREYSVSILAFDAEGRFIARSVGDDKLELPSNWWIREPELPGFLRD